MNLQMDWKGGFKFSGITHYGHEISTDASKKIGGNEDGYQPLELIMFSLMGCTGIDFIEIAKKMRLEVTDLKINVDATQHDNAPRYFTKANVNYEVTGKNLDPKKIERVIKLSQEKYCSAAVTISGKTQLSYTFSIKEG
ncbi:MAG: OsmC family protein [candidate division Zixibacteria bacterium]|nr:OsmC family protein [candidate division Zixibacteria bacterium]